MSEQQWTFYLIENGKHTYTGISHNPFRRLRCHNGELKGGSRHTKIIGPGWKHTFIINGFNRTCAIQFEYAVKHPVVIGKKNRIRKIVNILKRERWTRNSKPASSYELSMVWYDDIANAPSDVPDNVQMIYKLD